MSIAENIIALVRGERPRDFILPPIRLYAGGAEYFGEEAVLHVFRKNPNVITECAKILQSNGYLAIFDGKTAIFAKLYGTRIARLWLLSDGQPHVAEPAIGVPFDTDLRQSRRDVAFCADDHPELRGDDALKAVEEIGYHIAHGWDAHNDQPQPPQAYRSRPFAIAAFSQDDGKSGAVLFAVHHLGADVVRSSGFCFAAAHFSIADNGAVNYEITEDVAGKSAIATRKWRTQFA